MREFIAEPPPPYLQIKDLVDPSTVAVSKSPSTLAGATSNVNLSTQYHSQLRSWGILSTSQSRGDQEQLLPPCAETPSTPTGICPTIAAQSHTFTAAFFLILLPPPLVTPLP